MQGSEAEATVLEVIRRHVVAGAKDMALHRDTRLRDLGIDSMETIELLLDIESELSVVFPEEVVAPEMFATIGSLTAVVAAMTSSLDERS